MFAFASSVIELCKKIISSDTDTKHLQGCTHSHSYNCLYVYVCVCVFVVDPWLMWCMIQAKHQKHQAFESELAANADRIQAVIRMGESKC